MAMGTSFQEGLEQLEDQGFEIPPDAQPFFEYMADAGPFLIGFLFFCVTLLIAAVFSTVGGLIGGATFKYEPPAPRPTTDDARRGHVPSVVPEVGQAENQDRAQDQHCVQADRDEGGLDDQAPEKGIQDDDGNHGVAPVDRAHA